MSLRPNWAEVSLGALRHNFKTIVDYVAPTSVCAIVKADAYGHGAPPCALALEQDGAKWFAVTCAQEGIELRAAGVRGRILLMSGFWNGEEELLLRHNLTPVVWSAGQVRALEGIAKKLRQGESRASVAIHLKVNTGMNRLGCEPEQIAEIAHALTRSHHVALEGVLTHLASSEIVDAADVQEQLAEFERSLAIVRSSGLAPAITHAVNSGGVITQHGAWRDLVRPGISLYGYHLPFKGAASRSATPTPEVNLRPVLTWKTRIMALRDVPAGARIGYNGAYVTPAPAKIATLPAGYADGLNRRLSSRGRVIVRGDYAPIVGNISMDLTTVDVTRIPGAQIGDEVLLLGGWQPAASSSAKTISAWEHATLAETIPYEILCNIGKRVQRVYVE